MFLNKIKFLALFLALCQLSCQGQSTTTPKTSINGEVFTPKGELRALIIFAGFGKQDKDQKLKNWDASEDLPSYIKNGSYHESFFDDTSQFNNYPSEDNMSISRLFYEMSNPASPFKFMADVYPKRININTKGANSWGKMNLRVLEQMKKEDPHFDWTPYDNRKNRPNYLFDNSKTEADGKPDYVIICYRYDKDWKEQPVPRMNRWSGSGGGVSILVGVRDFEYNDSITIGSDGFHMNTVGVKKPESFRRLFQHELGHELLSCPHHFGTGGTLGTYFRSANMGWGTAVSSSSCTRLINAWERWMLGWIEIKHDLKDSTDNGTYTIDDYATTGEVIRIKIPHTNSQYLWIENHQLKSIYDQSRWTGKLENNPKGSAGIANIDKGLYLYIEDLMDEREKIRTYLVSDMKAINGTKFLNGGGNWDYTHSEKPTKSWKEYWNNTLYTFTRTEPNPFDGINPFVGYRFDANNDGKIDNRHNSNMGRATESFQIIKEKVGDSTYLFYANHGGINAAAKEHRRVQSFIVGDTLSTSHNPPIINNPRYNTKTGTNYPVFLNGIQLSIIAEENGKYTISVIFDNNIIKHDTRIAGIVTLKSIPNKTIDFDIAPNTNIIVNKSKTVNSLKRLDGSFINDTRFVIDSAVIRLQENSTFTVSDSSTVLFNQTSSLILNNKSEVIIKDKSGLYITSGAKVTLDPRCKIINGKTSTIHLQKGVSINDIILKQDFIFPQQDTCTGAQLLKKLKKETIH